MRDRLKRGTVSVGEATTGKRGRRGFRDISSKGQTWLLRRCLAADLCSMCLMVPVVSGWIRIDDGIGGHHKVLQIEDELYLAAVGLHTLGICYCNAHTTDGFIPRKALPRIAADGYQDVVEELLRVRLWTECDGGYRVHDYLEWQRSAEQIKAASEAGRNAVNKRWADEKAAGKGTSNTDGNTTRNTEEKRIEDTDKKDQGPREAIQETEQRTLSLPPCMSTDSVSNSYGSCQTLGKNIHAAAQSRWGILGHFDIAGFCGAVTDGCYPDCKGDEEQRRHCHGVIVKAIEDKRMDGTFKPHRALFAKIIQPVKKGGDRQWVSD